MLGLPIPLSPRGHASGKLFTQAASSLRGGAHATPRRELVGKALGMRQEWLALAAHELQLGLWYWDDLTQKLYWDKKTREMFGAPPGGEVTWQTFFHALHPDDREGVLGLCRQALKKRAPFILDLRAIRPDGSVRWISGRGTCHCDQTGEPRSVIGVFSDITEHREAEQKCAELSGRLINAQEEERRYLARELHDDFSQKLAVLANDLENTAEMVANSPIAAKLRELWTIVDGIGADLHLLSHRLHSSTLEILGLTAAVGSLCKEIEKQHGVEIDFDHQDIPRSISPEIALGLFRIIQEGLRNVSKHSQALRAEVRLKGSPEALFLSLSDDGVGFEVSTSLATDGIGIRSMQERARMLGGRFEIRSRPMRGTQISVRIPVHNIDRVPSE